MLIDEARYSLDIQYYLWYADDSGELLFNRAMDAAKRGVRDFYLPALEHSQLLLLP